MQSLLQYYRFGKHVARQYERDRSKAAGLANIDNSESTSGSNALDTPEATDAGDTVDTRDPEKGEQSSGQLLDAQRHVGTHDPEKEEEQAQSQGYANICVARTARRPSLGREASDGMTKATTVATEKSEGTALGTTLTGIDVRNRSTKEGGDGKVFVVGYEGENDIMNPHNWRFSTRLAAT